MRRLSTSAYWLIGGALLIAGFAKLTSELLEGELLTADRAILHWLEHLRQPALTAVALDVSALGSPTLLALFMLIAIVTCCAQKDRLAAWQLAIAAATAPLSSALLKGRIERARPTEVIHLVEVNGFSYPSGHSIAAAYLYLTLAIVIWTRTRSKRLRGAVLGLAIAVTGTVAASRAYLGVHYPSDTLGGMAVGAGLALLLAGAFSALRKRATATPST